ncbi:MAG TPA: polyamine aminopropyltransferase [Candidatus Brocadiales bacterium]|nr:polyamine aminopropyltransferase [Candidatus Brocadiales bacterium]
MDASGKKYMPVKWFYDYFNPCEAHGHAIKGTIFQTKSEIQEISIIETHNYGKCLVLDNEFQSAELDEFIYHEALVHPALITHPNPERIAIIGGGEGAALREVLRHKTVKKAVMIDIDKAVIDCAKRFLDSFHENAFDDPRVEVQIADGRKYLENTSETFDTIIIDVTVPLEGGPSYRLFTKEFYSTVLSRLTKNGTLCVQADTTSIIALLSYTSINKTLAQLFTGVYPYVAFIPTYAMLWGFSLATKGLNPHNLSKEEVDKRISARINGELKFYDGITHQALFNIPKYLRKAIKEQAWINRDDEPLKVKYPGMP